jgi:Protein of unknown function (DUF4233)
VTADRSGSAEPASQAEPAAADEPVEQSKAVDRDQASAEQTVAPTPAGVAKRKDPEKGFRGIMSGALVLQSITVLLGLPVASADHRLAGWELGMVLGLAVACIACCALVRRPWIVPAIIALQVVAIGSWVIYPALGIMGLIFAAVWFGLFRFLAEFRRRREAGLLPSQQATAQQPSPADPSTD